MNGSASTLDITPKTSDGVTGAQCHGRKTKKNKNDFYRIFHKDRSGVNDLLIRLCRRQILTAHNQE